MLIETSRVGLRSTERSSDHRTGTRTFERIESLYESESVRGSVPRLVRDVTVGDELGPIAKGPMAVTDIICWHAATGFGEFGVGALKLGYKNRIRVPALLSAERVRVLGCGDAGSLGPGMGRTLGTTGAV